MVKITKSNLKIFILGPYLAAGIFLFSASSAFALKKLTLIEIQSVSFDKFTVGSIDGTIAANGNTAGDVTCIESGSEAEFHITGTSNKMVIVKIDSSCILTDGQGNSMTTDLYGGETVTLEPPGQATIYIGAVLAVGADKAAGIYRGAYNVTVSYSHGYGYDYSATKTGEASAILLQNIALFETRPMDFGKFTVGSIGGTISPNGEITGDVVSLEMGSNAELQISGNPGAAFTVEIDSSCILTGGAGNNMTASLSGSGTASFDSTGQAAVNPIAELMVGADQAPGNYTGTYTISVEY